MAFEVFNFGKQLGIVRGEVGMPVQITPTISSKNPVEINNVGLSSIGGMVSVASLPTDNETQPPIAGAFSSLSRKMVWIGPEDPCLGGTLIVSRAVHKPDENFGYGTTYLYLDCIYPSDSGGGSGGGAGGSGPFIGYQGGGGSSRGRKDEEAERRAREIEELKNKLRFYPCPNYAKRTSTGGTAEEDGCCNDKQKTEIAKALYEMLNSRKVQSIPGLADCLLRTVMSKLFRCTDDPYVEKELYNFDLYTSQMSEQVDDYENGYVSLSREKPNDKFALYYLLLRDCAFDDESKENHQNLDMLYLYLDRSPDLLEVCDILNRLRIKQEDIESHCKLKGNWWLIGKYIAYNFCTGEVIRISSIDDKSIPHGPTIATWPIAARCFDKGFGRKDKDRGLGLQFIDRS